MTEAWVGAGREASTRRGRASAGWTLSGLDELAPPTLEAVERRRVGLFAMVALLAAGLAGLVLLLVGGPSILVRALLAAVVVGSGVYVWTRERGLRRLGTDLVGERVLSATLEGRLQEMASLDAAGKAVLSALELEDVLRRILEAATELLGADEGSVQLRESDELVVAAATGDAEAYIGERQPVGEGVGGYVVRHREPVLLAGRADPADFGETLKDRGRPIRSAVSVPLEAAGEMLGALNLKISSGTRRFTPYDLRALALFGEQASMAVRHARALRHERELLERLSDSDRIRGELVGSFTHDLKTPLTSIFGAARLLRKRGRELDEARRSELLESIERQAERQLALIERLLAASRSGAAQVLVPRPVDVVELCRALTDTFSGAHGRPIELRVESPGAEALVDGDALERALGNLLENAVEHTPVGTPVEVVVRSSGDRVEIEVADEGPGIPEDMREGLFEPYRRNRGPSKGAGLGLYIVGNLVHAMDGEVRVPFRERGTSFVLVLPAVRAEPVMRIDAAEAFPVRESRPV